MVKLTGVTRVFRMTRATWVTGVTGRSRLRGLTGLRGFNEVEGIGGGDSMGYMNCQLHLLFAHVVSVSIYRSPSALLVSFPVSACRLTMPLQSTFSISSL